MWKLTSIDIFMTFEKFRVTWRRSRTHNDCIIIATTAFNTDLFDFTIIHKSRSLLLPAFPRIQEGNVLTCVCLFTGAGEYQLVKSMAKPSVKSLVQFKGKGLIPLVLSEVLSVVLPG